MVDPDRVIMQPVAKVSDIVPLQCVPRRLDQPRNYTGSCGEQYLEDNNNANK